MLVQLCLGFLLVCAFLLFVDKALPFLPRVHEDVSKVDLTAFEVMAQ